MGEMGKENVARTMIKTFKTRTGRGSWVRSGKLREPCMAA